MSLMIDAETKANMDALLEDVHDNLLGGLPDALECLVQLRHALGGRDLNTLNAFDDVQACIFLIETLNKKMGNLISAVDCLRARQ